MSGRFGVAFSVLLLAACAVPPANVAAPPWLPASDGSIWAAEAPLPRRGQIGESYTIGKVGAFMPEGDISDLNEGFAAEVLFGRKLVPFLSIEGSVGYLDADGGSRTIESVGLVPLFVNARVSVPVLILEVYGGIGIGGIYADYKRTVGSSSDDFVAAGQAFLGLEVGLAGVALGAEYKYLKSEDTKDNFAIEGGVASLFVSIPF